MSGQSSTLSPYLSNKIATFHAIGILFVMLNHCGYEIMSASAGIFMECFANSSRWAVCMYFVVSGFLFFRGINDRFDISLYLPKYRRRIRTLLLPFTIWSLLGTVVYYLLYRYGFRDEWTLMAYDIAQGSFWRLFFHSGMLQMWFLRDLIWCYILAIPLYFILTRLKFLALFIIFILAYLYYYVPIGYSGFSISSILFFSVGASASILKWDIDTHQVPFIVSNLCFLFFFGGFITLAFFPYPNPLVILPLTIGCFISVWMLFDHFSGFFQRIVSQFCLQKVSFFMFATFEPFYYLSKHIVIAALGDVYIQHSILQVVVLSSMYIVAFLLINFFSRLVLKLFPTTFSLLTGGRS